MTISEIKQMFKLQDFIGGKSCKNLKSYLQIYFEKNCPATKYHNNLVQCYKGCSRSFYDLYFISKSKFPKTTREELAYILLFKLGFRSAYNVVGCIRCPNIEKLVFYGNEFHDFEGFVEDDDTCEYGNKNQECCDGLTFDLFTQMADNYEIKIKNGTVKAI